MTPTRAQRHDTRDTDRHELTLIRATHCLWRLYRGKSEPLNERMAILGAIETMVEVKNLYRKELVERRERQNAKVRERFASRELKAACPHGCRVLGHYPQLGNVIPEICKPKPSFYTR